MTELQWLIKMLTKHKLPASLKDLFIERIGEVEASLSRPALPRAPIITGQAPSTQRLLEDMATQTGHTVIMPTQIAQTATAAAALESRSLAIKQAASGKPEPGRTSPRKF